MEILSPAGSVAALKAAVFNGADAVYLGLSEFNARMGAENFTKDNIAESVAFCHRRGVRVHAVLNTLVSNREMPLALETAKTLAAAGVDAFIVQDLGLADELMKRTDVELHASTQLCVHSSDGVSFLADMGFRRVVLAHVLEILVDDVVGGRAEKPRGEHLGPWLFDVGEELGVCLDFVRD